MLAYPAREVIPQTALQQGFWECDIGSAGQSSWMAYDWPASSLLEQAFCQGKQELDLLYRGLPYKVKLNMCPFAAVTSLGIGAEHAQSTFQLNTRTGVRREVRRWSSRDVKASCEKQMLLQASSAWETWLQADWTWLLDGSSTIPSVPHPPRTPYSFGHCCFAESFWPELMKTWPIGNLTCAAHPSGQKCNFALSRILPSADSSEWNCLAGIWQQGSLAKSGATLKGALRVQSRGLVHGFLALRHTMLARLAVAEDFADGTSREDRLAVRMLWHGTRSASGLLDICRDGFDRAHAQVCVYGKGCYFASSPSYSDRYACNVILPTRDQSGPPLRAMLLAAVLVGEMTEGTNNMYPPPTKPHSLTGDRFENACDKLASPNIFVTFKDHQAFPAYVVLYEP